MPRPRSPTRDYLEPGPCRLETMQLRCYPFSALLGMHAAVCTGTGAHLVHHDHHCILIADKGSPLWPLHRAIRDLRDGLGPWQVALWNHDAV